MRICFTGFDSPIGVRSSIVSTLEVHNRVLFARICESLLSEAGEDALEPYSLWSDGNAELKTRDQFLFVCNPFLLPWDNKALVAPLYNQVETLLFESEECRQSAEFAFRALCKQFAELALQLQSEYTFEVDWDPKRYLKNFGFHVDTSSCETLLDNLILFLTTAKDVSLSKVIVFINLKLFLSETELKQLFDQIFFLNLHVMMLENVPSSEISEYEKRYIVDQDFLEFWPCSQPESTVSLQEGICSNGFGAVSF